MVFLPQPSVLILCLAELPVWFVIVSDYTQSVLGPVSTCQEETCAGNPEACRQAQSVHRFLPDKLLICNVWFLK